MDRARVRGNKGGKEFKFKAYRWLVCLACLGLECLVIMPGPLSTGILSVCRHPWLKSQVLVWLSGESWWDVSLQNVGRFKGRLWRPESTSRCEV